VTVTRSVRTRPSTPDATPARRLADFVVIGAMKSGTTTLFEWLAAQPDFTMPSVKEPRFFSDDERWARGPDWYAGLFGQEGAGIRGEASVGYTDPARAEVASARMHDLMPEVRLIYLVRNPLERLRSHYRHEVQRGRERRSFGRALRDSRVPYVGYSLYHRCLAPYLDRFDRAQILVVRFEDLVGGGAPAWQAVLAHVEASPRPAPGTVHNALAGKARFTGPMRLLWTSGAIRAARRAPGPVRRVGKRLLLRDDDGYRRLLESSEGPIAEAVQRRIRDEVQLLEARLGVSSPMWALAGDPGA